MNKELVDAIQKIILAADIGITLSAFLLDEPWMLLISIGLAIGYMVFDFMGEE